MEGRDLVGESSGVHHAVERFCVFAGDFVHILGSVCGRVCEWGGHDDAQAAAAAQQF